MEFVQGGDLYTLLRRVGVLNIALVSVSRCARHYFSPRSHAYALIRIGASFCIRNHAGLRSPALGRRYLPVSVLEPGSSKYEYWHKNSFTDSHIFFFFAVI